MLAKEEPHPDHPSSAQNNDNHYKQLDQCEPVLVGFFPGAEFAAHDRSPERYCITLNIDQISDRISALARLIRS